MPLKPCLAERSSSQDCSLLSYKSSARTLLCNNCNMLPMLCRASRRKHLLISIEMKVHESEFAVGKERMRQEIFLVCFFPLELGKCGKGEIEPMFAGVGTW